MALGVYMIDLADSCFKGVKIRNKDKISWQLVPKTTDMGKMNAGSNRQLCEFVCNRKSACDECTLQGAQNMTEAVCNQAVNNLVKHGEARIDWRVL